ncbi:MAG: AAA family ATPase [Spirochaetes bacterium]|nr:AAA family ATPase [Spirochaetota bacterium]
MIRRSWWEDRIRSLWERRPIVWLSGVRRVGKTVLCRSLESIRYFDCELPSVRREMENPEGFLKALGGGIVAIDEIHRLEDPASMLKIAADHFPELRIVATGSSTLGASAKFRDSLAGRKFELQLTPLCERDYGFPGHENRTRRFLYGGLPGFFLAGERDDREYSEWMEAFWARDILELFRLERRSPFLKFAELLLAQSGGRFNASSFASPCGVSRTTITNYLAILEATQLVHVIRPYHGGNSREIVAMPCVYGFDTGFVAWAQGLHEIPAKDRGFFWEHLVLNELHAGLQDDSVMTWRDKEGHEVDFVRAVRGGRADAIEVKWSVDAFEPSGIRAFRALHPEGGNFVVAADTERPFDKESGGLKLRCCPLRDLVGELQGA